MTMKSGAAVSAEYLFVRVHALWTMGLQGDTLRSLIQSRAEGDLFRTLHEWGIDPSDRTLVQKRLIEHMLDELGRVMVLCEPEMAAWYQTQMERFFFDNLKTLLHYRYFPERDVDIHLLLVESPYLPHLDPGLLLETPSPQRFTQLLPGFSGKEHFIAVVGEMEENRDIFRAEAQVDRLYLGLLRKAAAGLPDPAGPCGLDLVKTECDVLNALTLLRNAAVYHLPPEQIEPVIHPHGRLKPAAWVALAAQNSVETIRAALPSGLRRVLRGLDTGRMHLWENALWELLWHHAWSAFRDFGEPEDSLTAFPYLKWLQTLNINRIYEGFYFHLDPADILSMMIGL